MEQLINTIVVFRMDRMGDLIVSTLLLQVLRQNYPNAVIYCVCSPVNAKVLEFSTQFKVLVFDKNESCLNKLRFLWRIRQLRADMAVKICPGSFAFKGVLFSGARIRVALSNRAGVWSFINKLFYHYLYTQNKKIRNQLLYHGLSVLKPFSSFLTIPPVEKLPDLYIGRDPDLQNLPRLKGLCFGLHLDQRWIKHGTSIESIYRLCRLITEGYGARLIISIEVDFYLPLLKLLRNYHYDELTKDAVMTFLNNFNHPGVSYFVFNCKEFQPWVTLIDACDLWITIEGGSVHVASAVKTPVIIALPANSLKRYKRVASIFRPWRNHFFTFRFDTTKGVDVAQVQRGINNMIHEAQIPVEKTSLVNISEYT